jgi:hypothetical protein
LPGLQPLPHPDNGFRHQAQCFKWGSRFKHDVELLSGLFKGRNAVRFKNRDSSSLIGGSGCR